MPVDFSKLTGGQIALLTAIGAVLAALVAGSFALVVAWVNGMYAVRIARNNSQREFYLKAFKPYFDIVENDMFLLQQLVTRTTNLKSQSVAEGKQMMGDAHARLKWHQVAGLAVLISPVVVEKLVSIVIGDARRKLHGQPPPGLPVLDPRFNLSCVNSWRRRDERLRQVIPDSRALK